MSDSEEQELEDMENGDDGDEDNEGSISLFHRYVNEVSTMYPSWEDLEGEDYEDSGDEDDEEDEDFLGMEDDPISRFSSYDEEWDDERARIHLDECAAKTAEADRDFEIGDYETADTKFSEARQMYSDLPPINRDQHDTYYQGIMRALVALAHCNIKLGKYTAAVKHARSALLLIESQDYEGQFSGESTDVILRRLHIEALLRGAQASAALQDFEIARTYLDEALSMDAENADVITEMENVKQQSAKRRKTSPNRSAFSFGSEFGGPLMKSNALLMLERREVEAEYLQLRMHNISQKFLPNGKPKPAANLRNRIYCGEYSKDGSLFISASQDFKVRVYDATRSTLVPKRIVRATTAQWTLTDATLSGDNSLLIYSSITPVVHLFKIDDKEAQQDILNFDKAESRGFGIWSLRFSSDHREIIAGASDDAIYVYNIERQDVQRFKGHHDEVNAVCFASETDPNVFITGSDDCAILVWDRRTMSTQTVDPVGVLAGHCEGITYLSPKGDGRYVLSNAKDQTMKLWDLRKSLTLRQFRDAPKPKRSYGFDYRSDSYPIDPRKVVSPSDCSVQTFVSHKVLKTLIRCHFSPAYSTGQRFAYTGSADGSVIIYDLETAEPIQLLRTHYGIVVRDVSWHPFESNMMATGWDGTIYRFDHER